MKRFTSVPAAAWSPVGCLKRLAKTPHLLAAYIYLSTCPESGGAGLFYVDPCSLAALFGASQETVKEWLKELDAVGAIRAQEITVGECWAVWVIRQAGDNFGATPGPKPLAALEAEVREVPGHPFIALFVEKYGANFGLARSRFFSSLSPSSHTNPHSPTGSREIPVNGIGIGVVNGSESDMDCIGIGIGVGSDLRGECERGEVSGADEADEVWRHWRKVCADKGDPVAATSLSASRRSLIEARLSEGYSAETLKSAVGGIWLDNWFVTHQKVSLESALKDERAVERFAKLGAKPKTREQVMTEAGWEVVDFGNGPLWRHREKSRGGLVHIDIAERVDRGEPYFHWQTTTEPNEPKSNVVSAPNPNDLDADLTANGWKFRSNVGKWVHAEKSHGRYVSEEDARLLNLGDETLDKQLRDEILSESEAI